MWKFLWDLRNKYPLKTRIIFWLTLLFCASAIMNASLIYDKYNTEPKIITREIPVEKERIVTVTKVETKVITKKIPIETVKIVTKNVEGPVKVIVKDLSKTASENLTLLENGELKLRIESFDMVEDKDGKLHIPSSIYGEANLEYLYWDLDINLDANIKYRRQLFDARILNSVFLYVDENNAIVLDSGYFLSKNFKIPFGIKPLFLKNGINLGIGKSGVTITTTNSIIGNLNYDVGGIYLWSGKPGVVIGLSVKI